MLGCIPERYGWDGGPISIDRYFAMASERSCLGYPTSGQGKTSTGYQNTFQHGWITYNTSTKVTAQRCG